jgi:hypothetical protein
LFPQSTWWHWQVAGTVPGTACFGCLGEDPWSRGFERWAPVLPAVIAAAPSRVVTTASTILLVPLVRVEDVARIVVVANAGVDRWGLSPTFYCSGWTEASFSHATDGVGWSGSGPHRQDVELSACYTAAHLRRARSSPWACRPSRVDGLGIVRRRIAMVATLWLALLKRGG